MTDEPRRPREALIDRIVARARFALVWERVWPSIAAALGVITAFFALSWFGLWDALPVFGRIVGVLLFAAGLCLVLAPLLRVVAPGRSAALARIDRMSGLAHRPATSLDDRLASVAGGDPMTRALWAAHRERMAREADQLRAGAPAPRLVVRDPYALRFLLGLAAVAAFVYAGSDRDARVRAAFDWTTPPTEAAAGRVDAWLTPPGYTGRPPIFLTARPGAAPAAESNPADAAPGAAETLRAPANSIIVVRGSGGPVEIAADGAIEPIESDAKTPEGATEKRFRLVGDGGLRIVASGGERAWAFSAIPDEAPSITLSGPPKPNARGTATLAYEVKDDYGVVAAEARFALKPEPKRKPRHSYTPRDEASAATKRPLYDAPKVSLGLPRPKARDGKAETPLDVMEHPWAGALVGMTLVARDQAGQEGRSETSDVRLPARRFTKPLARALVEQRRTLALDANAKLGVLSALKALMLFPEDFTPEASVYLGLATAHRRLDIADTDDELRSVADYLWEIALRIEDGDLPEAERELRAAEEALRKALESGASEQEIQKLTQDLRQALEKFMREMAEQQRQNPGQQAQQNQRGDVKQIRPQDLRSMIDRMEQLSKQGAKDAARQALNELRNMLDNLQNAQRQQADPNAQAQQQQLDKLQEMIREQSKLRDKTFQQYRQNDRAQRNQQRGQQGRRQQQQNGEDGQEDMRNLAEQQQALREKLDQLRKEMQRGRQGEQGKQPGQQQESQQGENRQRRPGGQPGEGERGQEDQQAQGEDGAEQQGGGDQGQNGQGQTQQGQSQRPGAGQSLGDAGESMGEAKGALGKGQTGQALDQQQKALEQLRKGAQALAEQMQREGQGRPGENGQQGEQGAQNGEDGRDDDPLGRPSMRRDSDGTTTKVPGEIDAQRARRVLEELRRRLGDAGRPRDELDYLERLLTP